MYITHFWSSPYTTTFFALFPHLLEWPDPLESGYTVEWRLVIYHPLKDLFQPTPDPHWDDPVISCHCCYHRNSPNLDSPPSPLTSLPSTESSLSITSQVCSAFGSLFSSSSPQLHHPHSGSFSPPSPKSPASPLSEVNGAITGRPKRESR